MYFCIDVGSIGINRKELMEDAFKANSEPQEAFSGSDEPDQKV